MSENLNQEELLNEMRDFPINLTLEKKRKMFDAIEYKSEIEQKKRIWKPVTSSIVGAVAVLALAFGVLHYSGIHNDQKRNPSTDPNPLTQYHYTKLPQDILSSGMVKTNTPSVYNNKYQEVSNAVEESILDSPFYQYAVQFLPAYKDIKLHEPPVVHDKEILKQHCLEELGYIKARFYKDQHIFDETDAKFHTNKFSELKDNIGYMYQLLEDGFQNDNLQELTQAMQIDSELKRMLGIRDVLSNESVQFKPFTPPNG